MNHSPSPFAALELITKAGALTLGATRTVPGQPTGAFERPFASTQSRQPAPKPVMGPSITQTFQRPFISTQSRQPAPKWMSTAPAKPIVAAPAAPDPTQGAAQYMTGMQPESAAPAPAPAPANDAFDPMHEMSLAHDPKFETPMAAPSIPAPAPASTGGAAPSTIVNASKPGVIGPASASRPDYAKLMGSYDPKSQLDQQKKQRIDQMWQQSGGKLSPSAIYADSAYSQLGRRRGGMLVKSWSASPFACLDGDSLEKKAGPAQFLAGLARSAGGALRRSGARARINTPLAAKSPNTSNVIHLGPAQADDAAKAVAPSKSTAIIPHPTANAAKAAPEAMPGDKRMAGGKWLKDLAKKMEDPTTAGRINTGLAVGGGGAALYGSNRLGHSSGLSEGMDKGFDTGADYGIQAALQNTPQDPGILGRILNVFRGQEAAPDAATLQALLNQNKASILKRLRQTV